MGFTKSQIECIKSSLSPIKDGYLEEMYQDCLNSNGPVKIAGYEYDTSHALRLVDPTTYRCGLADYISSLLDDQLTEVDGSYFNTSDIENLIESLSEVES